MSKIKVLEYLNNLEFNPVEGVFEYRRLLALLCDFTVFGETGSDLVKISAGYHQFHAVKKAVVSTVRADRVAASRGTIV